MKVIETKLQGCFIIEPSIIEDERGYFYESFNLKRFEELTGAYPTFVQDNQSRSRYGVLRGLHFQQGEHAQAKLIRVLEGEALDIAVDIRQNSPTYGQYVSVRLSGENKKQLYVPRGFAHGFVVLSESCELLYKCDNYYHKSAESGILHNDSSLAIDWEIPEGDIILSDKDKVLKPLSQTPIV